MSKIVPQEVIVQKIFYIRGKKVMLDKDLAKLYGVTTSQLTRQVRRNLERFPEDFLILFTQKEFDNLMCQFGISSWGGTRKLPFAFTEQGIAMLSGVLHSERAIQVNVAIMRTFVRLRALVADHHGLARKLAELEQKYDRQFKSVFEAIREIMSAHSIPRKRIIGLERRDV